MSGHKVTIFDSNPEIFLVKDILKECKIVQGDIRNLNEIILACEENEIDAIVHMAYMFTRPSQSDPLLATNVNILGTMNVFETARLLKLRRVAWASSNSVFGPASFHPASRPLNETDPIRPTTVYGACKAYNEVVAETYVSEFGLSLVGLRICAVPFGLGMSKRKDSAVSFLFDLFENGVRGRPCLVPAADIVMQWQYVKDLAKLFRIACTQPTLRHSLYNVGGQSATLREIGSLIHKISGAQVTYSKVVPEFSDEVFNIDYSLVKNEFGYSADYSLESGLSDYRTMISRWEK